MNEETVKNALNSILLTPADIEYIKNYQEKNGTPESLADILAMDARLKTALKIEEPQE